ncbi:hypothetical protein [Chryseobacterium sp.]|uniref:hypothetical protein n=1 Tax=Chryseobacterium sp. TaxID=1871047 RepID=UPI000EF0905E|nr:hypothetical protein [Chryseobacterium sp.]HCA06806.1 hypothetical protein [Chryseobacterium sp.]
MNLSDVEKMLVNESVKTTIKLNNKHEYDVLMDIYLTQGDEFFLDINFMHVTLEDITKLEKINEGIIVNIESPYFTQMAYDIRQMVIVKIDYSNPKLKLNCFTNPKGEKTWII